MIGLENRIIKTIHCNSSECAIATYREIFNKLERPGVSRKMRTIKNYLIFLNSFIYGNLFENNGSNINRYKNKNKFNSQIENTNDIVKLRKLGEKMILSFIDSQPLKIKKTKNHIVNEAIKYIHLNANKDISLQDIANSIHISKNHLSFLFSKCLKTSFSDYLNKTRVDMAKELLIDSNISILDTAMECGFNSQSYFCCVFKKYENMTPKKYRDLNIQSKSVI